MIDSFSFGLGILCSYLLGALVSLINYFTERGLYFRSLRKEKEP